MQQSDVLEIWQSLPLIDRVQLYQEEKLVGVEGTPISQLFPEKRMVELWLAGFSAKTGKVIKDMRDEQSL